VRINRIALGCAIAEMAVIGLLAAVILAMQPLKTLVPFIVAINSDGTHDVLTSRAQLPADEQERVVKSELWQYVFDREGYYWDGAPYSYDVVSRLSDQRTRDEYQQWFVNSPDSPQRHPEINIKVDHVVDGIQFVSDHVATVGFWRSEQTRGTLAGPKQHYTARIGFSLHNATSAADADINPAGLKITSYHSDCDSCGSR
jgi:type IV secretion system protein VirB8